MLIRLFALLLIAMSCGAADLGLGPVPLNAGSANGTATLDANGFLTFAQDPKFHRIVAADCTAHAVVTGTAETVLKTFSFTAASLPSITASSLIRLSTLWTYTNSANNKTLKVRIGAAGAGTGGTALFSTTVTTTATLGRDVAIFCRATNSELVMPFIQTHEGSNTSGIVTAAIDLTANWELVLTGTTATSGETIQLESATVEIMTP